MFNIILLSINYAKFSKIAVPQKGVLMVTTEFGKMEVKPNEICIIQVSSCYKHYVNNS